MKMSGIYRITCLMNGRSRIGHSNDITRRWSTYKASLRGNYYNGLEMQNDWNEFGEDCFMFDIIDECERDNQKHMENYYINKYDCIKNGYNKNLNNVDKKLKVRNEIETEIYRKNHSLMTKGMNNGNCQTDINIINEIVWLKENTNMRVKDIAMYYSKKSSYISRIGKDRWLGVEGIKPNWYIGKDDESMLNNVQLATKLAV